MKNFSFKIKSNWFEKGVISWIGADGFWLYINLWRFFSKNYGEDIVLTSVSLIHKAVNEIYKKAGKENQYTKNDVIELLRRLKSKKVIHYDNNKYRFDNNDEVMEIKLLDLPETDEGFSEKGKKVDYPKTEDDIWLSINTHMINFIADFNMNEKHILVYIYLSKFNKECVTSCEEIAQVTGLGKNQVNKIYLVDLESSGVIVNDLKDSKSRGDRKYNNFYVLKKLELLDKFKDEHRDIFLKNEIKRTKKRLQKLGIGVSKKENEKIESLLYLVDAEFKEKYYMEKTRHSVLGIKYYYENLADMIDTKAINVINQSVNDDAIQETDTEIEMANNNSSTYNDKDFDYSEDSSLDDEFDEMFGEKEKRAEEARLKQVYETWGFDPRDEESNRKFLYGI